MYATILIMYKCGVTNENNRAYLENNRHIGENNKANLQELQNRIIGKIKSILGSGLQGIHGIHDRI